MAGHRDLFEPIADGRGPDTTKAGSTKHKEDQAGIKSGFYGLSFTKIHLPTKQTLHHPFSTLLFPC